MQNISTKTFGHFFSKIKVYQLNLIAWKRHKISFQFGIKSVHLLSSAETASACTHLIGSYKTDQHPTKHYMQRNLSPCNQGCTNPKIWVIAFLLNKQSLRFPPEHCLQIGLNCQYKSLGLSLTSQWLLYFLWKKAVCMGIVSLKHFHFFDVG